MTRIPTKTEILDWIASNPTFTAKRDIAKAFGIKGAARIDLKRLLKELEADGHLEKRKRSYQDPDRLPPVSVLQIIGPDADGDLFARPMEWHGQGVEPKVLVLPRATDPALAEGDRILARLTLVHEDDHNYEARLIRRIGSNPKRVLGVFRQGAEGGRILPIDKGSDKEWIVPGREDLRDLSLITIDPSDARDHDDACYAHADDDPKNEGGHIIWVAIADVAVYVTPGSALDREARKRGNSTYFPDRVVPMLPDRLSGDLCSLHEGVPRACIAVRMQVDADGNKIDHRFLRGLMRSPAALIYEEVQAAMDGRPNDRTGPLLEAVLRPLYAAFEALTSARKRRQPLDLDLPERRIILDDEGNVQSVAFKDRLDAHRLIEEFMVLANVAAAECLIAKITPLLFRVHEVANPDKLDALRVTAQASGFTLPKGQVLMTAHLNRLLKQAADTEDAELINMATLRSMTQAYYAAENFGHFGRALRSYAHFTSPIRRYSDLIVHRALITAHGWGKDGLGPDDIDHLDRTAIHISDTERRSMTAERDTTDRYLASYLSERVGSEFEGRISGIAKFGIFVRLDGSGADGLVPMRAIGSEYFHFDREAGTLMGADTGLTSSIGQRATVRLTEAAPVTGGIALDILAIDGQSLPRGRGHRTTRPTRRKLHRAKRKSDKIKRKVIRKRRS